MRTSFGRPLAALLLCVVLICGAAIASADTYSKLRYGSSGSEVLALQQALSQLGYRIGTIDGKFGAFTETAVRAFQRAYGLSVDGIAGEKTQSAIYSALQRMNDSVTATPVPAVTATPAPASAEGYFGGNYATLRKGASGTRVTLLQTALNRLGFSCGLADGKFGGGTYSAVVRFQSANGLSPDGAAGQLTLRRIEALLSASAVPTATATAAPTPSPTLQPLVTATPAGTDLVWTAPARTLRPGYSGSDVVSLQLRLQNLGWLTGVSGSYDDATRAAVTAFQQAAVLSADGIAGPMTYARLAQSTAPTAIRVTPSPTPTATPTLQPLVTATPTASPTAGIGTWIAPTVTLRSGSAGADVISLQQRLAALGWYTGKISGSYDAATAYAVASFQRASGLSVDGVAGKNTYASLSSANAARPTATVTPVPTATPASGSYTTLSRGSTGAEVTRLQVRLAFLDYVTNTYGTYDAKTQAAVRDFQTRNGLSVDGIAGPATQARLYSADAVRGGASAGIADGVGLMAGPDTSQIQLLHWNNDIKPTLSGRQTLLVYDPATSLAWTVRIMSNGRHCDVEPLTATDTAIMFRAFGNQMDWGPKPVYVQLPSGLWTVASTHNVAHGSQTISGNNFEGQNCVHFLRDMAETQQNDPNYGVTNQKVIRELWKSLTGQEITY